MKRWIAMVLCLVMCLSMCSVGKADTTIDTFANDIKNGVYYKEFEAYYTSTAKADSRDFLEPRTFDELLKGTKTKVGWKKGEGGFEDWYWLAISYSAFMKSEHNSEWNTASKHSGSTDTLHSSQDIFNLMTNAPDAYRDYVGNFIPPSLEFTWAKWSVKGNDRLINFTLQNLADKATIDAVDIAVYGENAYGEAMYPDDDAPGEVRYYTCNMTIKPGKKASTGNCRLVGLKAAKKVYVAVWRFHVKDGETIECGDPTETDPMAKLDWIYFDIK